MLNMSYIGNVLSGVTRNGVTKLYSHDVGGRLTEDGRTGVSVSYDVTGMPETTRTSVPGGDVAETFHSYLSDGTRLGVSMILDAGRLQVRTGYVNYGSLTFREIGGQQSFESSLFGGGVILSDGVRYFTRDHLGNTRVVTDGSGNVVERDDYYPFGERHEDSSMPTTATNRWRFAGKEIQPLGSTGWIDFGARQYDSFLGRWTTVDPLAEKYPGFSPYLYCAGNPVNYVDRSGQFPETLWDIANVVMDVKSLATNIAVGNVGGAIVDGIGLIADVASVALPGVPGGAGTAIKAARGTDKVTDAIKTIRTGDVGLSLKAPKANSGIGPKHGGTQHDNAINKLVEKLKGTEGVQNIRKNQTQVDVKWNSVGRNRPDIQYDKNDTHYNIEFDYSKTNSERHRETVTGNDPLSKFKGIILSR